MLTFNQTKIKDCEQSLVQTDQGLAFQIINIPKRKNNCTYKQSRTIDISDEETAYLQYIEHASLIELQKLATKFCHMIRNQQLYLIKIIKLQLTILIRKVLQRENVYAKRINSKFIEVRMCYKFARNEYEILLNSHSCVITLKIKNTTFYLKRDKHTLHKDSKAATEKQCGKTLLFSLEGNLMEYNRYTGTLKRVVTQSHQIQKLQIDWNFLKRELIIKNILTQNFENFEEMIVSKIENKTEAKIEVIITD